MANNIKGITIEIGGDTTKLDKALGGVNKNVKSTQAELREVEKLLKLDPKNTEALAQKQQLLTKAVGETKEKLDVLKTAEAQVEEQFKKGEVSEEQYRAIKREIEATELSLKKLEEEAGKSNLSLEKVGEAFGKVGGKATDIGNKLLPVTAGVTALGGAGVAAAMELDDGYDTIITKTGATGEALEELNGIADDLFTEMPIEMQDAGTTISIKDGLGNQLTETEISKPFEALLFSSPELKTGETYYIEAGEQDIQMAVDGILNQYGTPSSGGFRRIPGGGEGKLKERPGAGTGEENFGRTQEGREGENAEGSREGRRKMQPEAGIADNIGSESESEGTGNVSGKASVVVIQETLLAGNLPEESLPEGIHVLGSSGSME